MPQILRKDKDNMGIVAIWKMDEDWELLASLLALRDEELEKVSAFRLDSRKQEYLAVRCLIKEVLGIDPVIDYLPSGKPILQNSEYQLSISHTKGYVSIALSKGKYVGIDIEYPSERVARVYERFISNEESSFIPEERQLEYYTLIWCLKETMYKMIDRKSVIFNHHFICHPFVLEKSGCLHASYTEKELERMDFDYLIEKDYYLVFHC